MSRMKSPEDVDTKVTVRVPTDLLDSFDEVVENRNTNRSAEIRKYMRSVADAPDPDQGRVPPTDDETLSKGYKALQKATAGQSIPVREAKSVIARATNIPAESVGRRVIKPLEKRGYIAQSGDPVNDPWLVVR